MKFAHKKMVGIVAFGFIIATSAVGATLLFNSVITGYVLSLLMIFSGFFIFNALLKDPLFDTVEGEGFAVFDMPSTGVIQPYNCKIELPNVSIKTTKGWLTGLFDRKITNYLMPPKEGAYQVQPNGDIWLLLKKADLSSIMFSQRGRPTFLFNSKIGALTTKEMIADGENKMLTEHVGLTVLDHMKEFEKSVEGLNKHFADLFKGNDLSEFLRSPIVMIIIGIIIAVILFLFLGPQVPKILEMINGPAQTATTAVNNIAPPLPPNPSIKTMAHAIHNLKYGF